MSVKTFTAVTFRSAHAKAENGRQVFGYDTETGRLSWNNAAGSNSKLVAEEAVEDSIGNLCLSWDGVGQVVLVRPDHPEPLVFDNKPWNMPDAFSVGLTA